MGKETTEALTVEEQLAALQAENAKLTQEKEEMVGIVEGLNTKLAEVETAQEAVTGSTIKVGKKTYRVVTPQFYATIGEEVQLVVIAKILENKEMVDYAIEHGNLEEILKGE